MRRHTMLDIALLILSGVPSFAAVKVVQGVAIGDVLLTVTNQREVHALTAPGRPARLMGRLPRHASPLVSDGAAAWAVTVGRRAAPSLRLFQVHPAAQAVLELRLEPPSIPGRVEVDGVAGADARYVYLLPDLRIDLQRRIVERGQLAAFPDLQVLRVLRTGDEACYLARDRAPAEGTTPRLWLLRSPDRDAATRPDTTGWLKVEAGDVSGPVSLQGDERSLYLVFEQGRILRFDRVSLRLAEDLSPMLHPGTIRFFAAGERSYWIGLREAATGQDGNEGQDRLALWQIDREALDGGLFHAAEVPEGFTPLAATRDQIWFGATDRKDPCPLIGVAQTDGVSRPYAIRGLHARRWHAVGYGMEDVGLVMAEWGAAGVIVGVLTLPVWIWFV